MLRLAAAARAHAACVRLAAGARLACAAAAAAPPAARASATGWEQVPQALVAGVRRAAGGGRGFAAGAGEDKPTQTKQRQQPPAAAASGAAAAMAAATSPLSAPLAAPEAARAATGGSGDAPRVREFRVRRRNQQHSPKKLNLIAKLIRGKSLRDALVQCQLSSKKAAKIMLKALDNAAFIAHRNYSMDPSRLRIKICDVGNGPKGPFKRISYHGRGRSGLMIKNRSHVNMVVEHVPRSETLRHSTKLIPRWGAERAAGFRR